MSLDDTFAHRVQFLHAQDPHPAAFFNAASEELRALMPTASQRAEFWQSPAWDDFVRKWAQLNSQKDDTRTARGGPPQRATVPFRLPIELHRHLKELAEAKGIGLNRLLVRMIAVYLLLETEKGIPVDDHSES